MNDSWTQYATQHTRPEPELLQELAVATKSRMLYSQMLTGRIEARLLKMLVQLVQARYVLEIGMFTGYSALSMAEGMPPSGRLITCENNPEAEVLARKFFEKSPHGKKIEILFGDALETIPTLETGFDLVFLDADKLNYPSYYEMVIPMMKPGGVLAVDNALWYGKVIDPQDKDSIAIDALNKRVLADERVENVLLTIRDGVNLIRKKSP